MRRMFWLALGVTLGVWAALRFKRLVRSFTPAGIANQAAGIGQTIRDFADDVRTEMKVREAELLESLAIPDEPEPSREHDKDGK